MNLHLIKEVMFRQILLIFILLCPAFYSFGNSKADALRKDMYGAPDSTKAVILVKIAKLYQYENEDSCLFYARRASDIARRILQNLTLIDAETLLSQIALEKKNYVMATDHQKTILAAALRIPNWDVVMESYNAIAQTWLLRNNYAEAVDVLKKGLEIAKDRNNTELLRYYYQALVDSYRKLGNLGAVCTYYPSLMEVNRQVDAEAFNNRINALQTERETLILAVEDAKNWGQRRSTVSKIYIIIAVFWAVLASAALVLAYLWFRFKFEPDIIKIKKTLGEKVNELDSIRKNQESAFRFLTNHVYASINSLAQSISHFEKEQGDLPVNADSALNRINSDIFALYGFFQNFTLLLQAQSGQLMFTLDTVNIPQLANSLLSDYEYFAESKGIQLINEVQNNTFAIADERLIDVVLRNMMSNAFKYTPAGSGKIIVGTKIGTRVETLEGFAEDTEYVEVWVTDDGIGLIPEQVDLLFELTDNLSLPGDPDTKGYGVGLAVCKAVIEAFKGRIWVETKPGEGFCIRFNLPRVKETEVNTLSLIESTEELITTQDSLYIRVE